MKKKPVNVTKITVGVCAMDKKARSKPMREILNRLCPDLFNIVIFGDDCILNQPVAEWPEVDCLITFFSTHFPIERALEYIKLRDPFLINDLEMHNVLVDRKQIYDKLESLGINVPKHVFLDRSDPNVSHNVEEFDDYIIVDGTKVMKPFVEKPFDAENHNIYIYCKLLILLLTGQGVSSACLYYICGCVMLCNRMRFVRL